MLTFKHLGSKSFFKLNYQVSETDKHLWDWEGLKIQSLRQCPLRCGTGVNTSGSSMGSLKNVSSFGRGGENN